MSGGKVASHSQLSGTLKSLFAHKSWANEELFAVLASQPPDYSRQHEACLRTLHHVYIVDRIFRAHLCGEPRPYDASDATHVPGLEWLRQHVAQTDAWYEKYVDRTDAKMLAELVKFQFTDGNPGCMSREEILLHIATHGIYHRGGVAQLLKAESIAPPDDPYTVFLHRMQPHRRIS